MYESRNRAHLEPPSAKWGLLHRDGYTGEPEEKTVVDVAIGLAPVKSAGKSKKMPERACYRTDRRYRCKKLDCEWSCECKKLVAVWLR